MKIRSEISVVVGDNESQLATREDNPIPGGVARWNEEQQRFDTKKLILDTDSTHYVDGTNGNDANDGLTAVSALKSITKAIEKVAETQIINSNVTINVSPGVYDEIIILQGLMGKGTISLIGASDILDAGNYFVREICDQLNPSNGIQTIIKGFMTDKYSGWYSRDNDIVGTGNAQLISLASSLPLSPGFSSTEYAYTASTSTATTITLKPILVDPSGTIIINGETALNNVNKTINLVEGENIIMIDVIPSRLCAPGRYVLTVERDAEGGE